MPKDLCLYYAGETSWKRRWFVLKHAALLYFKTKACDNVKGLIWIEHVHAQQNKYTPEFSKDKKDQERAGRACLCATPPSPASYGPCAGLCGIMWARVSQCQGLCGRMKFISVFLAENPRSGVAEPLWCGLPPPRAVLARGGKDKSVYLMPPDDFPDGMAIKLVEWHREISICVARADYVKKSEALGKDPDSRILDFSEQKPTHLDLSDVRASSSPRTCRPALPTPSPRTCVSSFERGALFRAADVDVLW